MIRKLYATVSRQCCADNPDSPAHQEVLLPGYLYGMILKERMEEIVNNIHTQGLYSMRNALSRVDMSDCALLSLYLTDCFLLTRVYPFIFFSKMAHENPAKSILGHWRQNGVLPRNRDTALRHRPGPAASRRLHGRRGETELVPVYQPFQECASWCVLCGVENY